MAPTEVKARLQSAKPERRRREALDNEELDDDDDDDVCVCLHVHVYFARCPVIIPR